MNKATGLHSVQHRVMRPGVARSKHDSIQWVTVHIRGGWYQQEMLRYDTEYFHGILIPYDMIPNNLPFPFWYLKSVHSAKRQLIIQQLLLFWKSGGMLLLKMPQNQFNFVERWVQWRQWTVRVQHALWSQELGLVELKVVGHDTIKTVFSP